MPDYLHPGVYLEEIPSGVKPIEGVSTSIAAFIGATVRGPVETPILIRNWDEYVRVFGGFADYQSCFSDAQWQTREIKTTLAGLAMTLAAQNYFLNGGRESYFVRVADCGTEDEEDKKEEDPPKSSAYVTVQTQATGAKVWLKAAAPGMWGNSLRYKIEPDGRRFMLSIGYVDDEKRWVTAETFPNLSMDPTDPNYAPRAVKETSNLVRLTLTTDVYGFRDAVLKGGKLDKTSLSTLLATRFPGENPNTISFSLDVVFNAKAHKLNIQLDSTSTAFTQDSLTVLAAAIKSAGRALGYDAQGKTFTCEVDGTTTDPCLKLTMSASQTASILVRANSASDLLGLTPSLCQEEVRGSDDLTPTKVEVPAALSNGRSEFSDCQAWYESYNRVFRKLTKIRNISIVVLPGRAVQTKDERSAGELSDKIIDLARIHCEKETQNRMLVIDPPRTAKFDDGDLWRSLGASTYTAIYYPWVKVANPLYRSDRDPASLALLEAEPSALAAAVWARTDGRRGVWKAPAGVEATVLGIADLCQPIEDVEQNALNPDGINCLRKLPGLGAVVWGARTLAKKVNPEWLYIPVRRTALMIEQSIYNGIQWAVFEPNDHRLWSSLRVNIGSFMDGLYRAGAFQGEKASDAYFVRCGLGDTMTQGDIDAGRVIAVVGFAPLKPAEFVIVRIQQKVQQ